MKDYADIVGPDFLRVHQSHMINKKHVRSYIKTEGGYLLMNDDSRVPVSVRKKAAVIESLTKPR